MKMRTALSLSTLVLAILLMASSPATADTLSLVLNNPVQTSGLGSTVSFDATASAPLANGATVYLNSDSFDVDSPLTLDDSGFFLGFPLSLDPGDSFTGTLFTVTLPSGLTPGLYSGFFEILGGSDPGAQDMLASVDFQINAQSLSAVPEPGTLPLFATGVLLLAAALYNRRYLSMGRIA